MEHRLAMPVNSKEELIRGLGTYLKSVQEDKNPGSSVPIFTGNPGDDHSEMRNLFTGRLGETVAQALLAENSPEKLALYWTQGVSIPWELLRNGERRRISLPTYPFEKRRCWIDAQPGPGSAAEKRRPPCSAASFTVTGHTSTDEYVTDIISRISGIATAELDPDKPLDQYGFDSVTLMRLLQQLQTEADSALSLEKLRECRTIRDITDVLHQQIRNRSMLSEKQAIPVALAQFPELIHLNEESEGRPVFWFHAGLGGVETYQEIALKSRRPFYGIQARGWMTDRQPLRGIQAMATYYIHIIQSVQPGGPYTLGGYSLGRILSYEVTRQLQELDQAVDTIVMLDSFSSNELKKVKLFRKSAILEQVNLALLSTIPDDLEKTPQTLIHREEVNPDQDDDVFLEQLFALAKTRGLTMTKAQFQSRIKHSMRVSEAYELSNVSVLSLRDSKSVTCHYFRNGSGLILGELEPYFVLPDDGVPLDNVNYWEEWERQIPDFHITDVDSSCHSMMLSEPKAREVTYALENR